MVWSGEAKRQQNMNKLNVSNKFNLMSLQGCCLPPQSHLYDSDDCVRHSPCCLFEIGERNSY